MEAESDQQGWRVFMDCVVNDDDDDYGPVLKTMRSLVGFPP